MVWKPIKCSVRNMQCDINIFWYTYVFSSVPACLVCPKVLASLFKLFACPFKFLAYLFKISACLFKISACLFNIYILWGLYVYIEKAYDRFVLFVLIELLCGIARHHYATPLSSLTPLSIVYPLSIFPHTPEICHVMRGVGSTTWIKVGNK